MPLLQARNPFDQYFDTDGSPLDDGMIYIGSPGLNPLTSPIPVFWDMAGTIPAAQPIRTRNGYPYRSGTPANFFINGADFSITVQNKSGALIYSSLNATSLASASNVSFIAPDGSIVSLQDFAGANGATYIGYKTGQVSEFLDAGFFQPNDLDMTGSTEEGSKILAYLNTYKRVRLPPGTVRATLVVPSNCTLIGSGCTDMNRSTKVWASGGTTVLGEIGVTGSVGCVVGEMNIDAYATGGNALAGANSSTHDHYIYRVNTRANNHGQLWEQNGSDPTGASGGNIVVTDCKHYDGPNGFVSKMKDVSFTRCYAYDVTVQAHVAVSDNINGANIYSRAQNTMFIDCGGDGCNIGLTVYSRDVFSSTNANGVAGTRDIYWRGTHTNVTAGFIHVGLFRPIDAGTTAVFNEQVTIDGGQYIGAPVFGVRFDDAARPRVMAGHFQNTLSPIVYGVQCVDPYVSDEVSCFGTILPGILSPYIIENTNAPAINVDIVKTLLIVQNTAPTTITQLTTSARERSIRVLIDDNFTTLAIAGRAIAGKGSVIDLKWDNVASAWTDTAGGSQLADSEVDFPYAAAISLTWRSKATQISLTGNVTTLTVLGTNVPKGSIVTLRLTGTAAATIGSWPGVSWGTISPVGSVGLGQTKVIQMYYTGATFVPMSVNTY